MNLVDRIRRNRPLVMFGDGTAPWSFTFAPDLARGFVGLLGEQASFGQAYHITSEERRLWRDLYLELGQIVGREPRLVYLPSESLAQAMPDLFQHIAVEKTHPGLFDNSKIRTVIPGFQAEIDLRTGLENLVESWERDGLAPDPEKERLEDRLVAVAEEMTGRLHEVASVSP
jgi:nucleoside-diphosphate-sugar epimerase